MVLTFAPDWTARDAAVGLHAEARARGRLLVELRTARAEATVVREQERMMLHRDLHDGLGPLLTGAALHLDAARNLDGAASATAIDEGRAELRTAIADIRRVAHGLRPTELENGDLWTALERRSLRSGARLQFPEPRPALTPATELAAYRIIGEALANAERHAPAPRSSSRSPRPRRRSASRSATSWRHPARAFVTRTASASARCALGRKSSAVTPMWVYGAASGGCR
jgi:signal transduction histidine kinase